MMDSSHQPTTTPTWPPYLPVVLVLAGALACQPAPSSSSPALASRQAAFRIGNSLTTERLVLNALLANPAANELLSSSPLKSATFGGDSYLGLQLHDEDAQAFMDYLVSCALEPGQTVSWDDPLEPFAPTQTWEGQAGLCPGWFTAAPTQSCLERVSACLLARNNPLGRRVVLSMRGEPPASFGLDSTVPVDPHAQWTWEPLPSFQPCLGAELGADRSCGWLPAKVGACQPLETVRLGAGGIPPDQCVTGVPLGATVSGRAVLRVCKGSGGCESTSSDLLATSEGSCAQTAPAVSFTCPASGTFSVMIAPFKSKDSVNAQVVAALPATYPAAELEVFRVREGAFYGNLFDAGAINRAVRVWVDDLGRVHGKGVAAAGSVFLNMYSCWDSGWTDGAAYMASRLCALPEGENCAAVATGPCASELPVGRCAVDDGALRPGDGDFEMCADNADPAHTWLQPVTSFLHQPCDAVDEPQSCARLDGSSGGAPQTRRSESR